MDLNIRQTVTNKPSFCFVGLWVSTIITNCCHRQRLQIQYPKITNRHKNDKDKVSSLQLTELEQLQEDKNVVSDVKAEAQAIKTNEVNEEKTDAQVEALTKQEAVCAPVKWEDTFGAIDFCDGKNEETDRMNRSLKHYFVHLIFKLKFLFDIIPAVKTSIGNLQIADAKATKEHHEKGRKQDRKKKTKKYGAGINKLTKGYSQKELYKQVLLQLFD
ncbi:hypothetical protein RFI_36241 [Reticulomyxa filosa]|uniref:Uncharacterized protein n=1 Tax=Reticulomyxa filosa TaxID=46433 RepID=X6LHV2_RETFI|nr:hypothetical protein RFI_36241 [Reticulomyxa filosa]|eukprot:ETO01199.1 hypothetical protein RFI_36241 [Reticulomyxa filosa]